MAEEEEEVLVALAMADVNRDSRAWTLAQPFGWKRCRNNLVGKLVGLRRHYR